MLRPSDSAVFIFGLGKLRFHDMRHTFITLMGERGVPVQVLGAMVGHMSPAMVRYYTHISSNAARQSMEMLDKIRIQPSFVGDFVDDGKGAKVKLY